MSSKPNPWPGSYLIRNEGTGQSVGCNTPIEESNTIQDVVNLPDDSPVSKVSVKHH